MGRNGGWGARKEGKVGVLRGGGGGVSELKTLKTFFFPSFYIFFYSSIITSLDFMIM